MTYIVKDECIKCKLTDCVEVCPVDCFYEGENMLAIKPDECIDCGVCQPECPIDAIQPDTDECLNDLLELNKKYSNMWPNITKKRTDAGVELESQELIDTISKDYVLPCLENKKVPSKDGFKCACGHDL